nr:alpha/beta hydrolase [Lactobacillus sp. Sy-1]
MLVVALIIVLGAAIFVSVSNNENDSNKSSKKADRPVPTLYIIGANASQNAANHLMAIGNRDGGTPGLTVTFGSDEKPIYKGKLTKKVSQPMIKLTFNSKTTVFEQMHGIHNVLAHLKAKYGYANYNAVGFSGGAVAALSSASDKDTSIPEMSQLISIGAGYNGVMKTNDKPNSNHLNNSDKPLILRKATKEYPSYKELISSTKTLPKNVKVLNIYGNSAGKANNDGVITNVSSESLKYLVKSRTDNYQAIKLTGSDASHNGLFNHPVVDRLVEKALFDKR